MSVTFEWQGMSELLDALERLPADLTEDASAIVDNRAELAKSMIQQGYPRDTGDLRDHLTITTIASGQYGIGIRVANNSHLAYIFENGSEMRHTAKGWNRGRMPPGHIFIPAMQLHRGLMYGELRTMLETHGLVVTGDA